MPFENENANILNMKGALEPFKDQISVMYTANKTYKYPA